MTEVKDMVVKEGLNIGYMFSEKLAALYNVIFPCISSNISNKKEITKCL